MSCASVCVCVFVCNKLSPPKWSQKMIVQEVSGQCEVLRHNDTYVMKNSVESIIHLGHLQIQIQAPLRSK